MRIKIFNANPMATNTYIISADNKDAAIIDPIGMIKSISKYIEEQELNVKYILLTHGHADHIELVEQIKNQTNAQIAIHTKDEEMLGDKHLNLSTLFGRSTQLKSDILLEDGDELSLGDLTLKVIHTPGHSRGSISIQVGDVLFTGDTLFKGSIGRTDFYGGDYSTILQSLKKISKLSKELTLYPGHGEASTLEYELTYNPYFKEL